MLSALRAYRDVVVWLAQIIGKAKVPIIKFQELVSGLAFDVSFNAANGPQAAEYVRDLMQQLPPMRSLILVLKVFLHQRELNEVGTRSAKGITPHRSAFCCGQPWHPSSRCCRTCCSKCCPHAYARVLQLPSAMKPSQ